jgi:putative inorganic carbon (HCO3(-)) transporter
MGTFSQVANAMYPFFLAGPDADIPHAHNLFLQVAVDLGLPGLVAWLASLLLVILASWQVYRQGWTVGQSARLPYLAGLGAVIVWAVWGVVMAAGSSVAQSRSAEKVEDGKVAGWYKNAAFRA